MIRRADFYDIEQIISLLKQVHQLHSEGRPDIFRSGAKKYTVEELKSIVQDDKTPVYVFEEDGAVLGYVFCVIKRVSNDKSLQDRATIYIDDLCVDSSKRGLGIGTKLFEYVVELSKKENYDAVTLNVWDFNQSAMRFYEKLGMKPLKTMMEYKIM